MSDLGTLTDRDILIRLATQMEAIQSSMEKADERLTTLETRLSVVETKVEKGVSFFGGAKSMVAFMLALPVGAVAAWFGLNK